jgi:predicted KAP-like P-loop ATPase
MEPAIMNEMMDTDAGRELARQYQVNKLAERQAIADEIIAVRNPRGVETTPLSDAQKAALEAVETAQQALEVAEERHRLAHAKHLQVKARFDARSKTLEKTLIQSAPEEIDVFIRSLRDEVEEIRRNGITMNSEPTGKVYVDSSKPVMRHFSNASSIDRRMRAIRQAIDTAEGYKREALDDLDVRLRELRDGLPELVVEQVS